MDEIQQRLQDTSKNCLDAYGEWSGDKKNTQAQEKLHTAIHELRKVSSRLEIELAISERDEIASKPLPIPPHRSSKGNKNQNDDDRGDSPRGPKPKMRRKPGGGGKKTISIETSGE